MQSRLRFGFRRDAPLFRCLQVFPGALLSGHRTAVLLCKKQTGEGFALGKNLCSLGQAGFLSSASEAVALRDSFEGPLVPCLVRGCFSPAVHRETIVVYSRDFVNYFLQLFFRDKFANPLASRSLDRRSSTATETILPTVCPIFAARSSSFWYDAFGMRPLVAKK